LTREVIFMGGGLYHATSSFNVYFDAEAAKIAFRAPWPKFTVITVDLAETVHMADDGKVDRVVEHAASPIAGLFRDYEQRPQRENPNRRSFRMPDEMMATWIIDQSIFTEVTDYYVDVVTEDNGHYGDTLWWDAGWRPQNAGTPLREQNNPSLKAGRVNVPMGLDKTRFRDLFLKLMTQPIRRGRAAANRGPL
jgi:inosine-uridine nucleoside N-ribohydrolase